MSTLNFQKGKKLHQIFQGPFLIDYGEDFAKNYIDNVVKLKNRIEVLRIPNILSKILNYLSPSCDILFVGSRFRDLASHLNKKNSKKIGFIGGIKTLKTALEIKAIYYPVFHWLVDLIKVFEKDPHLKSHTSQELVNKFVKFLLRKKVKYIILSNDVLFLERFIIFAAKKANITTIYIQDGVFQSKTKILHGQFSDFIFVWGEYQKELYLRNKFPESKIKILGYPFEYEKENKLIDKSKICILGQPFENYSLFLGKRKVKIFEKIASLLKKTGYRIAYKPHPGEIRKNFLPNNVCFYTKNLKKAFKEFDVFISLTSTALLEASINGKIAIQIYDPEFRSDYYEKIGYSYTVNMKDITSLPRIIYEISSPYKIPPNVIYFPKDIASNFLKLLENLH